MPSSCVVVLFHAFYHIADWYFFLYIYHKSLIQSKVTYFFKSGREDQIKKCSNYCVIKCIKTKRVLKGNFASSIFHTCNAKTQICVTGPQCVILDFHCVMKIPLNSIKFMHSFVDCVIYYEWLFQILFPEKIP
jgi:hypothetical protein